MRRVAVIGPDSPCAGLSGPQFVELLAGRLGWEAFSLRPLPSPVLATDTPAPLSMHHAGPSYSYSAPRVEADMLIWLRFAPRAYWRDWIAGWLDTLLNGAQGARRRAERAHLADVGRAWAAMLKKGAVESRQIESLRPQLHFVELSSPDQALFWLKMQEERARETEPPRL